MKPPPFAYHDPTTVEDAADLIGRLDNAMPLAGGQSLMPMLNFRVVAPDHLIDLNRVAGLSYIEIEDGVGRFGAMTRQRDIEFSADVAKAFPVLHEALEHVGHRQTRNRGTIGGSLAYADPAAELPACCVALDATIVARSAKGERRIPAAPFFTGLYTTALTEHELIAAIEFPVARAGERSVILELTRRSGDYAMAGVVARAKLAGSTLVEPSLVFFGVGDRPITAERATSAIAGKMATPETIARAQAALDADLDPPADQHGSPDMKRHLARVLLARALGRLSGSQEVRAA